MNIKATMAQHTIENYLQVGAFAEVLDACKDILKEARDAQDRQSETMALIGLAQAHRYLGKFYEARVYADGGLKSAQELGQPELIVMALNSSAAVYLDASLKVDEAEADYRAALQLAYETEQQRGIAASLAGIATTYNHAREYQRAVKYAREAFEFAREVKDYILMATTLSIMGNGFTQLNQPEKAHKAFDDALELCDEHNIPLLKGYIAGNKGLLLTQDKRYFDDGWELLEKALSTAQQMKCVPHEFAALHRLALTRLRLAQYDVAEDYLETMLARTQVWKNRAYEGMTFYELGRLHLIAEQYDEAVANFEQSLIIHRETMNPFYEAQTEAALGMTCSLKRDYEAALSHYMAARTLYDALEDDVQMWEMTRAIILTRISRILDTILRFIGLRSRHDESYRDDDL